ncbi:MAG: hypothetical protein IJQ11_01295, partial [Bacteroidales bacterium]|nr:hypothetical protein [Bacteroidales bacterium]
MQAIHNILSYLSYNQNRCFKEQRYKINASNSQHTGSVGAHIGPLFQRAKIQDKCKQFTTMAGVMCWLVMLFQRAKIQ